MEGIDQLFASNTSFLDECLIRGRAKTTGISTQSVMVGNTKCQIHDVGGTWVQRRKWIRCFKDSGCCIFVVALTGYCEFTDRYDEQVRRPC